MLDPGEMDAGDIEKLMDTAPVTGQNFEGKVVWHNNGFHGQYSNSFKFEGELYSPVFSVDIRASAPAVLGGRSHHERVLFAQRIGTPLAIGFIGRSTEPRSTNFATYMMVGLLSIANHITSRLIVRFVRPKQASIMEFPGIHFLKELAKVLHSCVEMFAILPGDSQGMRMMRQISYVGGYTEKFVSFRSISELLTWICGNEKSLRRGFHEPDSEAIDARGRIQAGVKSLGKSSSDLQFLLDETGRSCHAMPPRNNEFSVSARDGRVELPEKQGRKEVNEILGPPRKQSGFMKKMDTIKE